MKELRKNQQDDRKTSLLRILKKHPKKIIFEYWVKGGRSLGLLCTAWKSCEGGRFFYSHFLQSLNKFNVFGERQKMVSSINSKSVYLELQFEENSIRLETLIEKILCPGLYFWTVLQNGTMISIYSVCKYWQGTPSCIYRSIAIIGSCIAQPWVDCLVNLHHAVQKRKKNL